MLAEHWGSGRKEQTGNRDFPVRWELRKRLVEEEERQDGTFTKGSTEVSSVCSLITSQLPDSVSLPVC